MNISFGVGEWRHSLGILILFQTRKSKFLYSISDEIAEIYTLYFRLDEIRITIHRIIKPRASTAWSRGILKRLYEFGVQTGQQNIMVATKPVLCLSFILNSTQWRSTSEIKKKIIMFRIFFFENRDPFSDQSALKPYPSRATHTRIINRGEYQLGRYKPKMLLPSGDKVTSIVSYNFLWSVRSLFLLEGFSIVIARLQALFQAVTSLIDCAKASFHLI